MRRTKAMGLPKRFKRFDYSYVKGKPYQIVDERTGDHMYFKTKALRDKNFKVLQGNAVKERKYYLKSMGLR
jgi:hypothetical protein